MALSATATRILGYLPVFYREDPILLRIVQAWANEVDRMDARLDAITNGLVPALASDELGFLAIWEFIVRLPVRPPDATESQRRGKVLAQFQSLGGGSAANYIATLNTAIGTGSWTLLRDTPGSFQDTLEVPFDSTGYNAIQIAEIARQIHPAHRQLFVSYGDGWVIDASVIDLSGL